MARQTDNNRVDRTLRKLSLNREAPKSAFILLLMLFAISIFLTSRIATSEDTTYLFGIPFENKSFAGIFSMMGNICLICLAMLFRKTGYFTALALLVLQFPLMYMNIIVRRNYTNIPGLFNNILIIIAITFIFFGNRKIQDYQNHIREQAVTDRLTGLPNRFACTELMQDLLWRTERFAVVSADLNNFKSINDTMGHDTGDNVLKEIARRWKDLANSLTTGTIDFVARITGDEFFLILTGYNSEEDVLTTIEDYKEELEKKITIDDCDYYMTACFGYSMCPEDSDVIDNLFTFSDAALHEVKKTGSGSRILRFTMAVLNSEDALEIERKIRAALTNDKIFCHLQPQYDMDHSLRGFEALARMKDDNGSYISPMDFIPVAEKTGLVDRIDMRVFELAVQFLDNVINETGADITLSANVSVRHLMKNNFTEDLKKVLDKYSVSPERIEIEITESIMIDSAEKALQRIDELKQLGMKVAIDDFGTGYSSLSYLNNFPTDMLKIDKSFIDNMSLNESSKQYVAMIISIGHTLDLKVISEGVESADQVMVLKDIGCDYIQGYVWGKPMLPEDAFELVGSCK
ncbi:MAG: bifunctional diguanylate cyclase/phosphodiesterase [Clostridiales bacterium]|nr:bifunctional diguanylate cyclase/phosphodiesterase [Clostridiales bacterium]